MCGENLNWRTDMEDRVNTVRQVTESHCDRSLRNVRSAIEQLITDLERLKRHLHKAPDGLTLGDFRTHITAGELDTAGAQWVSEREHLKLLTYLTENK